MSIILLIKDIVNFKYISEKEKHLKKLTMSFISKKYRQFHKSLIVLFFFKLENGNSRAGLLGNIGSRLKYLKFLGQLIVAPEMHSKRTYFIAFCIFETLASIGRLILILI